MILEDYLPGQLCFAFGNVAWEFATSTGFIQGASDSAGSKDSRRLQSNEWARSLGSIAKYQWMD
jgi:hypothetical protein